MTSPGGMEIQRLAVRVVPDTSKLPEELRREIKKASKGIKIEIPVHAVVEGLQEELKKVEAEVAKTNPKIDLEVDGDGAARETRRIRTIIQKTLGAIKTTLSLNLPASMAIIRTQMALIQKRVQGYNIRVPMEVVGISKWLAILTAISGILLAIPHLIGAIGGAAAVVGGLFATLPGILAGVVVGISAIGVGMNGFMDAMSKAGDIEKFNEALKTLTPNAQKAARALATWREPLSEIRKATQEALFENMDDAFIKLRVVLGPIKSGLAGVASGINGMIRSWVDMASSAQSVKDIATILDNTRKGFTSARPALADFGAALRDITVVGTSFFPMMGRAVNKVAGDFRRWAADARETGKMQEWIQNAFDKLKQLGRITADIWVGFRNIFDALKGGEDFLDIVERVSQAFRDWTETDETQKSLQALARVMRVVVDAATELFGQVFKTAGEVFRDLEPFITTFVQTFGTVFANALKAITPLLKDIARWLSENKEIMVPLLITIISLVTGFKLLVTAAKGIQSIGKSFEVLRETGKMIGGVGGKFKEHFGKIAEAAKKGAVSAGQWAFSWAEVAATAIRDAAKTSAAWIKSAAKSAAFTTKYYAIMVKDAIKSFARVAAAAVANAAKTAAAWITNIVRMVATTVAQMAVAAAAWVAHWTRMAAVALAQAARMAAAWLIAMGPIGLIIAAVVALVALIILNWDRIKNATKAAWDWIWNIISTVVGWIVDRFNEFVGWLKSIWDGLWSAVTDVIQTARDVVSGIVESIIGILRGIGNVVSDVIGFFEDIYNGIIGWFQDLLTWLKDLGSKILGAIGDLSSLLWDSGRQLVQGLWDGWESYFSNFRDAVVRDGQELVDNMNGLFKIFSPSRVFRKIGEYLGLGLIVGMESQRNDVFRTGDRMGQAVLDGFGKPQVEIDLLSGLEKTAPEALKNVKNFADQASQIASASWNANLSAEEVAPLEDRILSALASGLVIEMDGQKVTKSVNKNNNKDRRRS